MYVCMHNVEKFYRICNRLLRSLIVHLKEKVTLKVALTKYLHNGFFMCNEDALYCFTKCM